MSNIEVQIPSLSSVTRGINYPANYPLPQSDNINGYLYNGTKGSFIAKANSDFSVTNSPDIFEWKQRPDSGLVTSQEPVNLILKVVVYSIDSINQILFNTSTMFEVSISSSPTQTTTTNTIVDSIEYTTVPNPTSPISLGDPISLDFIQGLRYNPQAKSFTLRFVPKKVGIKDIYKGIYYIY